MDRSRRSQSSGVTDAGTGGEAGTLPRGLPRRRFLGAITTAAVSVVATTISLASSVRAAHAATNCMNVLVRDAYWGAQFDVYRWVTYARNLHEAFADAGFTIDGEPSTRALMVWGRNYGGAAWTGHVAIVEAVIDEGTVLVRHENWPRGSREHVDTIDVLPGHRFIHPQSPAPGTLSYPDELDRRAWSARLVSTDEDDAD
jgi:surface antigen